MRFFHWRRAFRKSCATRRSAVALLALAFALIVTSAPVLAESHEATAVEATFGLEYSVPNGPRNLVEEAPQRIWYTAADGIGFLEVLSDPEQPAVLYHTDFYGTGKDSQPYDLVFSKGVIWFTLHGLRGLGRIDIVTRQIKVYTLLTVGATPTGIDVDPTGKLWIAQSNERISRFDPVTEEFTEFFLPEPLTEAPRIEDIAYQDEHHIWLTMPDANKVLIYDSVRDRFSIIPTAEGITPMNIAFDPNGGVWVSAFGSNLVGHFTPTTISIWAWYATPSAESGPVGILTFKDDNGNLQVWLTENKTGTIGRIRFGNSLSTPGKERLGPDTPAGNPWGIIHSSDGHIWVADPSRNLLYELTEPFVHELFLSRLAKN